MKADVLGLDPVWYRSHTLHSPERAWQRTNPVADVWIELLHSLGHDPVAGVGAALAGDFDDSQWRMFAYPTEDLFVLYGIEADELDAWGSVRRLVAEQLALGHLVALEVDGWWLPDTSGDTYRRSHQRTTIVAQMIDTHGRRLGYFHGTGYFELSGENFDAVLPDGATDSLAPRVVQIRLGGLRTPGRADDVVVAGLARRHLSRRPADNPIVRMGERLERDLATIALAGEDTYRRWAAATMSRCGATAELAAELVRLLAPGQFAAERFDRVASGMKGAELVLARTVKGRQVDVAGLFAPLAEEWELAMAAVAESLFGPSRVRPMRTVVLA